MNIAATRVYFIAAIHCPHTEVEEEEGKVTARLGIGGEGGG